MSESTPDRPDMADELARAYARAHGLADDGRGPSAQVRARVLAAARAVAAEAGSRRTPPSAAPVVPPLAAAGRGRPGAANLASWRVRAGAALCAALLAGVAGWRLDASRHADRHVQVASADRAVDAMPPPPRELPAPAAPPLDVPPPADARAAARASNRVAAEAGPRDRAQADRAPRARDAQRALPADHAPAAKRGEAPPSELLALAPPAPDRAVAAQAEVPGVALAGPRSLAAASPRAPALPPLQSAADRGDAQALQALLADAAARVDAPDADGRTALLHAVLAQQPEAVRLLLAAGADPGRADHAGLTPRQAARSGASAEVAALLAAPR